MVMEAERALRRFKFLLAWAVLLTAVWSLWLWRLDASDLTFDEAATYYVAYRPTAQILTYLSGAVREHPPVYFLLIHGWMALVGQSEFSLRVFSVAVGLVALGVTGRLARFACAGLRSPWARRHRWDIAALGGWVAAALLGLTPGVAYYAREARMYSLGVLWTALSAWLFLRDWLPARRWPRQSALLGLAITHTLALFTHYYLVLPMLAQPLALLLRRRWRPLLAWCGLHGALGAAGLLWLRAAPGLQLTTSSVGWSLLPNLPTGFDTLWLLGKLLFSPVVQVRFRLLWVLLVCIGLGLLSVLSRRRWVGIWLTLALALSIALVFALPNTPAPRFMVFAVPFVGLALAQLSLTPLYWADARQAGNDRGLRCLPARPTLGWMLSALAAFALGVGLVSGGLSHALAFERSRYGRTLALVQAHARPGDGVLFYGPWQWVQYRYYRPSNMPPITTLPPAAPPRLKPAEAQPVLEGLLRRYQRLWVLPAAVDDVDPRHFVEGWLNTHAHLVWRTEDFSLYVPLLPEEAPRQPLGLVFGDYLTLEEVAYDGPSVPAGEALRVVFQWRPRAALGHDVRLTLSLADAHGQLWGEAHAIPGEWAMPPSTWVTGEPYTDPEGLLVPQGAPPGDYALRVTLTDAATGAPLRVNDKPWADVVTIAVTQPVVAPVLAGLPNADAATCCVPGETTCVSLAGYEPGGLRFVQGYPLPLALHWLVAPGTPPLQAQVRLIQRPWQPWMTATPVATATLPLGAEASAAENPVPSARLLTMPVVLEVPVDAPTGRAEVVLSVLGPDGSPWQCASDGPQVTLFSITMERRPVARRLPAGFTPLEVDFGPEVGLRGYRIEGNARPGGRVRVTYAWFARTQPTAIYAVFNHVLSADGTPVVQVDGWPQGGRLLSIQWQRGEYIEDSYTLAIPSNAPAPPYTLYVGLYNAATNERMPATRNGERLREDRLPLPLADGGRP